MMSHCVLLLASLPISPVLRMRKNKQCGVLFFCVAAEEQSVGRSRNVVVRVVVADEMN